MKAIPMIGLRFGRLIVTMDAKHRGSKRSYWCDCDCGESVIVIGGTLRRGECRSCGCLRAETRGNNRRTHGLTGSPSHQSWVAMRKRCRNAKSRHYKYYGGRGIKICERWEFFENFLADMGMRPSGKTLDRKDNDGNYCKDNCRWATPLEQSRNRRPWISHWSLVTHCPRGHEYSGDNLYTSPDGDRRCRQCHRSQERIRRAELAREARAYIGERAA